MKAIKNLRERRAISPVIATVILVAVAITVAVGVSYWMSGIAGQYTAFEKVEIQTAICSKNAPDDWVIEIQLKNSGTAAATLTNIFINEIEVDTYSATWVTGDPDTPPIAVDSLAVTDMTQTETIESGATKTIVVCIDGPLSTETPSPGVNQWQSVSSGTTINIKIHSAGGMDYIKLVKLT